MFVHLYLLLGILLTVRSQGERVDQEWKDGVSPY